MRILYICPDLGIPVLGRKGASVHVRSLSNAFARAGHSVVLAAPILNKSPWDEPAGLAVPLFHLPPAPDETVHLSLEAFNELLGVSNSIPGEIRRILYNEEMLKNSSAGLCIICLTLSMKGHLYILRLESCLAWSLTGRS